MRPFRTSLTARLVSVSIAIALAGVGTAAIIGTPDALPYILMLAIGGCVVGLIVGTLEHTWPTMALIVALPLMLWPYVMLSELILRRAPLYGWALIATGAMVAAQTVFAGAYKPRVQATQLSHAVLH